MRRRMTTEKETAVKMPLIPYDGRRWWADENACSTVWCCCRRSPRPSWESLAHFLSLLLSLARWHQVDTERQQSLRWQLISQLLTSLCNVWWSLSSFLLFLSTKTFCQHLLPVTFLRRHIVIIIKFTLDGALFIAALFSSSALKQNQIPTRVG